MSNNNIKKIEYLDDFLQRYSIRNRSTIENRIKAFGKTLKDKNILEADYDDVLKFLKEIDEKDVRIECKEAYRITLNTFYETVKERFKKNKHTFMNPVPSKLSFIFSDRKNKQLTTFKRKYITYESIDRILRFLFAIDEEMYILVALTTYTGARIGEICTIQTDDISLIERKFVSGRIEGNSKSGLVLYFWPRFFHPIFSKYVLNRKGQKWLFPSRKRIKNSHIVENTVYRKLMFVKRVLNIKEPVNPHCLREAINSYRRAKGLTDPDLSFLINQKPGSVNMEHYMKRFQDWENLQKTYDNYFPYPILIF